MLNRNILDSLPTDSSLSDASIKNLFSLVQISREVSNYMSNKLVKYGLTQASVKILLVLFVYKKPFKPSDLAEYAGVTRSTMTGLLDGLENKRFIQRGTHDDRRMTTISLTVYGEELMEELVPLYVQHVDVIMSELTEEDHQQLSGLLQKIQKGLNRSKE